MSLFCYHCCRIKYPKDICTLEPAASALQALYYEYNAFLKLYLNQLRTLERKMGIGTLPPIHNEHSMDRSARS